MSESFIDAGAGGGGGWSGAAAYAVIADAAAIHLISSSGSARADHFGAQRPRMDRAVVAQTLLARDHVVVTAALHVRGGPCSVRRAQTAAPLAAKAVGGTADKQKRA
ncbi:hypothetical protein K32_31100 [Kaistia sp. 32K]|uniref:hypothetical protein n=1 Tax=Kaistia sp. 32K TaxID=2795690 RepID=UPI001915C708|nr:hypothetical protein [Kaistia sp. 32K]BCP54493.1 hypothetical protein K32_31100 [Kaistia sp. 32K]